MKTTSMKFSRRALLALAAATVALPFVTPGDAFAGTVEEAKAKGKVVIGIQGDNSPWGFVNSSGVQDGLDADIGKAFADYLGVKAEFVPLAVANRIPALLTGKVDVLFATMAMTAERAKSIQYSKPYVGNVFSVYAPKDKKIAGYDDLTASMSACRSRAPWTRRLLPVPAPKPISCASMTTPPIFRR